MGHGELGIANWELLIGNWGIENWGIGKLKCQQLTVNCQQSTNRQLSTDNCQQPTVN